MFGNAIHQPTLHVSIYYHSLELRKTQQKLFPGEKNFKLKTQQGRMPN